MVLCDKTQEKVWNYCLNFATTKKQSLLSNKMYLYLFCSNFLLFLSL